ncbi:unnamed protein product [Schistosoma turkestanicum]|nr:unnamed protein product [Schistosoma turkestanicum]
MTDSKQKSLRIRVITLLLIMTMTLYLAVELNLFFSDQYVFYSAVTEQGLPYYTKKERLRYKNISDVDKHKLKLAQKKASTLEAASNAVRITLGLITTLIVGYLSDRYGRRVALGILIFGELLHIGLTMSALADLQYVAIYLMGPPFLWSPETVGLYSGVTDVTAALISVICTVVIIKFDEKRKSAARTKQNLSQEKLHMRQMNLLITVFAISIIMLIVNRSLTGIAYRFQLPTANILIYIAAIPRLMRSFFVPILRTMLSISIRQDIQGIMQSVAAFVSRIGLLISLTALPAVYAATVLTFPGTVFIIVVIILVTTLILDLLIPLVMRKQSAKRKNAELNSLHSVRNAEAGEQVEKSDNITNYFGDTF